VRVVDDAGDPVAGVTVDWVVTAGGGSITPASSVTGTNGEASTRHTLGTAAGAQAVTASAAGLSGSPATFTAAATHGAITEIVFMQQPGDAGVLRPIAPPVRVRLRDRFGNPATGATASVTMHIAPSTGTPGAHLSGTVVRTASNGEAVFDDLGIDLPGLGYRLRATTAGGLFADSAPFNVIL
jgi:hypothetical protein